MRAIFMVCAAVLVVVAAGAGVEGLSGSSPGLQTYQLTFSYPTAGPDGMRETIDLASGPGLSVELTGAQCTTDHGSTGEVRTGLSAPRCSAAFGVRIELVDDVAYEDIRGRWHADGASSDAASNPFPLADDPTAVLPQLRTAALAGLVPEGHAVVSGVATSAYQATVTRLSLQAAASGVALPLDIAGVIVGGINDYLAPLRITIWIDRQGRVRRLEASGPGGNGAASKSVTEVIGDFGLPVAVTVPRGLAVQTSPVAPRIDGQLVVRQRDGALRTEAGPILATFGLANGSGGGYALPVTVTSDGHFLSTALFDRAGTEYSFYAAGRHREACGQPVVISVNQAAQTTSVRVICTG